MAKPGTEPTPVGATASKNRYALFFHTEKKLAGWIKINREETGPLRVRLEPWGAITGRIVDNDRDPLSRFGLRTEIEAGSGSEMGMGSDTLEYHPLIFDTDADGRFRYEGIIPGLPHRILLESPKLRIVVDHAIVKTGETRDLGEVVLKSR